VKYMVDKKKVIKLKKQYLIFFLILFLFLNYFLFFKVGKGNIEYLKHYQYFDEKENYILSYASMKHAKKYQVTIKKNKEVIFNQTTSSKTIDFSLPQVKKGDDIQIIVKGVNLLGLSRTVSKRIKVENPILKVNAVSSSHDSGKINGFKQIILNSHTENAKIYYTIDGTPPSKSSLVYERPIYISKSMDIKAIAVLDGYEDSEVSTFSYQLLDKRPIVYLSPSTQGDNYGVESVGYTTEKEMMNKIADIVYKRLVENDIVVYSNKKVTTHKEAALDSKKYDVDLHLALHSNASDLSQKGKYSGIETWIYDDNCVIAKEIAKKLQSNLFSIYYKKNSGNRGVKTSIDVGGLLETNPKYVNNGILIEVAFHDNRQDAKWIVDNIEKIGNNIANSIISYYKEVSK